MLHQVGVGVLGPVFRTYEPGLDRLVAVKVFRLDLTPEQARDLADRLQQIAELRLSHPSLVTLIAAGVEDSTAYAAVDYVAAESLDVAMRHYAPAPLERVHPFMTQLAGAIDFAAAAKVYHGGLHPRDVFITPDIARAGGFGVAQALEHVGARCPVRRPYTAPERLQSQGGAWSAAADVFSLAAIAFELLTGRRFVGIGEQSAAMLAGLPNHAALVDVFSVALAEDPDERFPTALSFAGALEAAGGTATAVAAEVPGPVAARPRRRKSRPAATPPAGEPRASQIDRKPIADTEPSLEFSRDVAAGDDSGPTGDLAADVNLREQEEAELEQNLAGARPLAPTLDDRTGERGLHPPRVESSIESFDTSAAVPRSLFEALDAGELEDEPARQTAIAEGATRALERSTGDEVPVPVPVPSGEVLESSDTRSTPVAPPAMDIQVESRHPPEFEAIVPPSSPGEAGGLDIHGDEASPVPALERERSPMLPVALGVMVGVLVGFVAGYGLGSREGTATRIAGSTARPGPEPPSQPWSEAAVDEAAGPSGVRSGSPPAPPAVPADAPRPSAPRAEERREPVRPVPSAPPAAPVAEGRLLVRSTPAGATVAVDGRERGTTPLTLRELPFGTYSVRVTRAGYEPAARRVAISRSRPAGSLTIELRPIAPASAAAETGSLMVESRPRGARVLVNGSLVGTSPLLVSNLKPGLYQVRIEHTGYRPFESAVRVGAGDRSRVTASLNAEEAR